MIDKEVKDIIVTATINDIVKEKWEEIVWPKIQDYLRNVLLFAIDNILEPEQAIDIIEKWDYKKMLEKSDDVEMKMWFEKNYSTQTEKEKKEVLLFIKSIISLVSKIYHLEIMKYDMSYLLWYIEAILNDPDASDSEKITELKEFLKDYE